MIKEYNKVEENIHVVLDESLRNSFDVPESSILNDDVFPPMKREEFDDEGNGAIVPDHGTSTPVVDGSSRPEGTIVDDPQEVETQATEDAGTVDLQSAINSVPTTSSTTPSTIAPAFGRDSRNILEPHHVVFRYYGSNQNWRILVWFLALFLSFMILLVLLIYLKSVHYFCTKHIDTCLLFLVTMLRESSIKMDLCRTEEQVADISPKHWIECLLNIHGCS